MARVSGITTPTNAADGTSKQYADSISGTGVLPPGAVIPYSLTSAPVGFLDCDGTAVSRTTYSDLFAILSTTYGVGDGSTTFNLPDLRQRIPIGRHSGGSVPTLGATGGALAHTHNSTAHAHTAVHSHSMQSHTHNFAHTHDMANHTHTMGNHIHGMQSHGHTMFGHGHALTGVTVSTNNHGHTFGGRNGTAGAGTSAPRSSDGAANDNLTSVADTHSHTTSAFINGSGNNGDGNLGSGGPSNNNFGGPSTNTTGGPTTNTTGGASATTSGGPSAANTDSFGGNTDSGGAVATNAGDSPYFVLHFIIKT